MCQYPYLCVYHFRFGVDYIGLSQQLPESSYTSSSIYGSWFAKYARLDDSLSWVAKTLSGSWLEVDMLDVYTVIGLMMVRGELMNNILTIYDIKVSTDGVNYQYIAKNVPVNYLPEEDYVTYWFENATQAKIWRMEPVASVLRPNVKGDIIGYL